jgi:hypothetical protein
MWGKMSVGMVIIEVPPRIIIKRAITMIVYGRRNANRTIHIPHPFLCPGPITGW